MTDDTFNLSRYVRNSFDGMLVIGDVHADIDAFRQAVEYAKREHYFLMSLGDLVDRGPNPYEVVDLMHEVIYNGDGGFVIGNHDNKFYRHANGSKVVFSQDAQNTIKSVGEERMPTFLQKYCAIVSDRYLSGYFHEFDNIMLVHGATHPAMWEESPALTSSVTSRAMYGETTGEFYEDGKPVRHYTWMSDVPEEKVVIVGHDRAPIHNEYITEPMVVTTENKSTVIFLDTGCGKGGFLSGQLILKDKKGNFVRDGFLKFN